MNPDEALIPRTPEEWDEDEEVLSTQEAKSGWQMKKLKPRHKMVGSLLAQGMRNVEIAKMLAITPEYVSALSRQPLMQAYIQEMCQVTGLRLESMFEKSVDVIGETLRNGTEAGKLKAARLQLEATKRIGRYDPAPTGLGGAEERLIQLAERLLYLSSGSRRTPGVFNEDGTPAEVAEFSTPSVGSVGPESAQTVRIGTQEGGEVSETGFREQSSQDA